MSRIFRAVQIEDADKYLDIILQSYEINNEFDVHFSAQTATKEDIVKHISDNKAYVLEENGTFISTVSLRFPWGPNPGPIGLPHIGWFATNPAYKRQGIGIQVMKWLEEEILKNQLKLPAVTLGTADNHPFLKEMYEKMGFIEIGTRDLGKGHLTVYFLKVLQPELYQTWAEKNKLKIIK